MGSHRKTVAALAILAIALGWLSVPTFCPDEPTGAPAICWGGSGPTSPAANPRMDSTAGFAPGERFFLISVDALVPERIPRVLWFAEDGERPGFASPLDRPPRVSA
jgi:hypothetical protein